MYETISFFIAIKYPRSCPKENLLLGTGGGEKWVCLSYIDVWWNGGRWGEQSTHPSVWSH